MYNYKISRSNNLVVQARVLTNEEKNKNVIFQPDPKSSDKDNSVLQGKKKQTRVSSIIYFILHLYIFIHSNISENINMLNL